MSPPAALQAAASVHASARKAPRPSLAPSEDSRYSATPDPMLSPSLAQLLARYNPPSDGGASSLPPSVPGSGPSLPTTGPAAASQAEDLAMAMRGFTPFSKRGGSGAGATQPSHQQQQQPAAATTPSDDDTCSLYQELIKSRDVPSSLAPGPQQHHHHHHRGAAGSSGMDSPRGDKFPAAAAPGLHRNPSAPASYPSPMGTSVTPPTTLQAGRAAAAAAAAGTPGRSVTPRSVARADWKEHDKVLAEKMAGLESIWVESGQAALTPLRKSLNGLPAGARAAAVGPSAAGAGAAGQERAPGGGGTAIAAALAAARARSPGPARAAAEAAAAAEALLTGGGGGVAVAGAAARGRGGFSVMPLRLDASFDAGANGNGNGNAGSLRVLSPVVHEAGAREGARSAPREAWAAAGGDAVAVVTTVVGATVASPRSQALTWANGSKAAGGKPAGTPGRASARPGAGPATPGRRTAAGGRTGLPSSPAPASPLRPLTAGGGGGGATTPHRAATRGSGAVTPGRVPRVSTTAAAAADRNTPLRKSCGADYPGMAAAVEAVARAPPAAAGIKGSTPGRVARPASAVAAAAAAASAAAPAANRTPGRIRVRVALFPQQEPGDGTCSGGGGIAAAAVAAIPHAGTLARPPSAPAEDATTEHVRRQTWGSAASSSGGSVADWQGFPLSRAVPPAAPGNTAAATSRADSVGGNGALAPAHHVEMVAAVGPPRMIGFSSSGGGGTSTSTSGSAGGGGGDDVTLAMPPAGATAGAAGDYTDTPSARTPGGSFRVRQVLGVGAAAGVRGSAAAGGAGPGAGGVGLQVAPLGGLSPGTSALVSKALGEAAVEQLR